MSQTVNLDRAEIAQAELAREGLDPGPPMGTVEELKAGKGRMVRDDVLDVAPAYSSENDIQDHDKPTEEDLQTLRRVSGKIKWTAFSVAICELAERFSYYGSSVLYTNFVVQQLPPRLEYWCWLGPRSDGRPVWCPGSGKQGWPGHFPHQPVLRLPPSPLRVRPSSPAHLLS